MFLLQIKRKKGILSYKLNLHVMVALCLDFVSESYNHYHVHKIPSSIFCCHQTNLDVRHNMVISDTNLKLLCNLLLNLQLSSQCKRA